MIIIPTSQEIITYTHCRYNKKIFLDLQAVYCYTLNASLLQTELEDSQQLFYWGQPFLVVLVGWVFSCSTGKKPFLVGLVDQLFQQAQNLVEMVENDG